MKETKEHTNKWKYIRHSWNERINIVKNVHINKSNIQIQYNPYQIPLAFFTELEQKNLKICMETQKTLNRQSSLEGKKRSWRNQTP